ncbi:amidohydrolase [Clostridium sp. 19966]|uniref:M20 metallopeptidase family protein n=1 Tax=Clostridium sp. 19966 TaxID=2768166 RepID=UPI0028E00D23|nr:amidohydrolase [Clostridium sp. 19966]MDT8715210.1 amidohydrolase [Clostridium sp. 19966]
MENKFDFYSLANGLYTQLVEWRRYFHQNPELGYEEFNTSKTIKAFLKAEGIEYTEVAGTGICGIICGGKSSENSKTIALRADMDALPLQDKKACEYSSKSTGRMHACGHDGHMTILMGAAKILNSIKSELKGNVKLLFEPAEETTGGAKVMIAEKALENPHVDAVIGLHVAEDLECGKIKIKKNVVNAASNPFKIKIIGKGGHGAHPEDTIDPVVIASNIIIALQTIVSREIPPVDPAVVTVGYINGGSAQNIIPEEVNIGGIIRTMKSEHREYVVKRVKEVAQGIAASMRGKCEVEIEESYPCLYNNDFMVDLVRKSAEDVIGADNVFNMENPSMGVESFAYFSLERDAAFYFLGSGNKEKGIVNPAHGSLFDIDENCLQYGVAIQCKAAFDYLQNSN